MSNQAPSYDFLQQLNSALGPPPAPQAAPPAAPAAPQDFNAQIAAALGHPEGPPVNDFLGKGPIQILGATPTPIPGAPRPLAPVPPPPPEPAPAGTPSPPPAAAGAPGVAGPPQAPPPPGVTFAGVSGGAPAHSVEMRSPELRAEQHESNLVTQGAIDAIRARSEQAAAVEGEVAAGQVRAAYARQEGAETAAAEREAELQQRQQDFDASVKTLSKMSMDPNRFWASRNTGQKIAAGISLFFGGFVQGATGGANVGLDMLNQNIDRDIKAQEFAYNASRDTANAKQTAFALAMQKYGSVDAARAMARAASLDAVQAQLMQTAAMFKGTDAGNQADQALVQLQKQKEQQTAQGIAFVQASGGQRMYLSPEGIPMTEAEAKAYYNTQRGYEQDINKIGASTAGNVIVEGAKAAGEQQKREQQYQVRLPSGEIVSTQTPEQHKDISQAAAALTETRNLIGRAKQLREASLTGKPLTPGARAEMAGIRADLLTNYGVAKRLGALSESDYKQAEAATGGDLFSVDPGVNTALDASQRRAEQALTAKVATIPGASPRAQGKMPSSTQYHGGK